MHYTSSISYKLVGIISLVLLISLGVYKFEILGVVALFALPIAGALMIFIMGHPHRALDMALIFSFLAIGIIRYIGHIPFGLAVDLSLLLAILTQLGYKSR